VVKPKKSYLELVNQNTYLIFSHWWLRENHNVRKRLIDSTQDNRKSKKAKYSEQDNK